MKNINNKLGLALTLILTSTLLITGCSSTKGIVGSQNLNTNSSSTITSFDFLKKAGNQTVYHVISFDAFGNINGNSTANFTIVTTDYVTTNAMLNHTILLTAGESGYLQNNYAIQTETEFYSYDWTTHQMELRIRFPFNQSQGNIIFLGQENFSSPIGNLPCSKFRENYPDGSYAIGWINQKYMTLKSENYSSQNIKTYEMNVISANF